MNWKTGVSAGGIVLLAMALGGLYGLMVVMGLTVCWGLLRSIDVPEATHDQTRSRERNAHRHEAERKAEQQGQHQRRQQTQERETERRGQRQSERAAKQSEENGWWNVLEVPPHASSDEIRRAYRRKIKQCHPDRVAVLAPEFLELAERSTRTLNAAYSEANRARRKGNNTVAGGLRDVELA
jgi:molecular chaperone GrpE (heat shock protein)